MFGKDKNPKIEVGDLVTRHFKGEPWKGIRKMKEK